MLQKTEKLKLAYNSFANSLNFWMDRFFQIVDSQTFDSTSSETFNFDVSEETFN